MQRLARVGCALAAVTVLVLARSGYGGEAGANKMVWTLPVYLTEGMQIKKDTPATAELVQKAGEQCVDAQCNQQVAKCKADIANCVLSPNPEALKENRMERGDFGKNK